MYCDCNKCGCALSATLCRKDHSLRACRARLVISTLERALPAPCPLVALAPSQDLRVETRHLSGAPAPFSWPTMVSLGPSRPGCLLLQPAASCRPFTSARRPGQARRAPIVRADLSSISPDTIDAVQTSVQATTTAIQGVSLGEEQFSPAAITAGIAAIGEASPAHMHASCNHYTTKQGAVLASA